MKPILLLHGAIGAADQLQTLATVLENRGYQVHTLNFSGHGGAAFTTRFGIEAFAEELSQYMLQYQLQQADVFGYSMGGYVALYLALQQPELLGKIVTLATKVDWNEETAQREAAMLIPERIEAKVPQFAAALKSRHGNQWTDLLERTRELMLGLGSSPLLSAQEAAQIKCPVMMGVGDSDSMVSLEETRALQSAIPGSALYVLPRTAHPIEKISLDLLVPILCSFFGEPI